MTVASLAPSQAAAQFGAGQQRNGARLRVLNAASGTLASQRATSVAATIAAERGGELVVVHVQPPRELRVVRLGPTVVRSCWLDDPYSEPVLLAARRLAWANGIMARIALLAGLPADGVVMAAGEFGAGLVVIGSRTAWLPAPTRARIQRACPVPVLAVSRGRTAAAAGGSAVSAPAMAEAQAC